MELNIKFDEKLVVETANRVLDEFEYKGKTIRKWADSLTHPKTNADRIRAMTDEELAKFVTREDLCELTCNSSIPCDGRCEAKMLDWLRKDVSK